MNPAETSEQPVAVSVSKQSLIQRVLRYLYAGNPFYLLSVCFVFHGTAAWFQSDAAIHNPWPLMGLISTYVVALAVTAFVIVRFGNVWDDARSIFVIVLILFVEMSLCFDDVLSIFPAIGKPLLLLGLLLAISVTECLLLGLRMRMPMFFRLPLHGMLALLFLYPLCLVPDYFPLSLKIVPITWRLFLFAPLAAVLILTLLSAVRRGPGYVNKNGTPWSWPLYPWTAFGTLIAGLGVRTYTLTLSFDPVLSIGFDEAMKMPSIFGKYFLVPIVLAVGLLLLETAIVTRRRPLAWLALTLPFACLWLAIPSESPSIPYLEFLSQFSQQVGSPLWLTLVLGASYLTYALMRRVQGAEQALVACLLLLSFVGRQAGNFGNLYDPHAVPFAMIALLELLWGIISRDSRRAMLGVVCGIVAAHLLTTGIWPAETRHVVAMHSLAGATIFIGLTYRDPFALLLRRAGACLVLAAGVYTLSLTSWGWRLPAYTATLVVLSLLYAWWYSNYLYLASGLGILLAAFGSVGWQVYHYLKRLPEWRGLDSFLIAAVTLLIAVVISACKAGWASRLIAHLRSSSRIVTAHERDG